MKALIIDDEPMPSKHLEGMIKQHCFEVVSTYMIHSPVEAIEHLRSNRYDLIFLDVEMPGINGFELLEEVQLDASTQVIFTTAYSQYALDAFKANAAHYILKLVNKDELIKAVRKAMNLLKSDNKKDEDRVGTSGVLSIFDGEEYHIIREKDVIRLEADGSYTRFVLAEQTLLSSKGIGYYSEKLSKKFFIRCHNSHLINAREVIKMNKGRGSYITLSNNDVVPLSTSKKEELENMLGL